MMDGRGIGRPVATVGKDAEGPKVEDPAGALRELLGAAMKGAGRASPEAPGGSGGPRGARAQVGRPGVAGPSATGALAGLLGRARVYDRQRAEAERERQERVLARLREAHMVNMVALLRRMMEG